MTENLQQTYKPIFVFLYSSHLDDAMCVLLPAVVVMRGIVLHVRMSELHVIDVQSKCD
jgi:hypothetical protein